MFHHLSERISLVLLQNKIIPSDEREIYSYGLEAFLLNGAVLVVAFLTGIFTCSMLHFVVFVLVFVPLRMFTGGFHAKTSERCFIGTTIFYLGTVCVIQYNPTLYQNRIIHVLTVAAILFMMICSPLENRNHLLEQRSRHRNKCVVVILLTIDSVVTVFAIQREVAVASDMIVFLLGTAFLLLLGWMQNRLKQMNRSEE